MILPGVAGAQDTRVDAPIPHAIGQSVSASFEGWYPNPDGTRSLVFGYFNRNYEESLDLPVGEDNMFDDCVRTFPIRSEAHGWLDGASAGKHPQFYPQAMRICFVFSIRTRA